MNVQNDVGAMANLEITSSEGYMNIGPFMEYSTVVAAGAHANNSASQGNIGFSQNMNISTSVAAVTVVTAPVGAQSSVGAAAGAEVDILQAALHLADISEEELKAEELHTSLYPMQESHDMLPLVVSESGGRDAQIEKSYSSEVQSHMVIASSGHCNAQMYNQPPSGTLNQNLMSVNVNDSQAMMSQQRPTVVMSAQIQPSFQAPQLAPRSQPPTTAKSSNSRKRKASSNQSSASSPNGLSTPRPRGRPKSPKGQPKNTPKKKPQPFISTYNGQKVSNCLFLVGVFRVFFSIYLKRPTVLPRVLENFKVLQNCTCRPGELNQKGFSFCPA